MGEVESTVADNSELQAAYVSFAGGLLHDAFHALQRHLTQQPDCGRGWELLGLVYHAWQQWGPGLAALEEASVRVPMSPVGDCALADCYLAVGKQNWARDLYRQLIQRKQVPLSALLGAASGLDVLSESRLAALACRRAIKLDPSAARPHFDLSYYLTRCGSSISRIEASARRAIELAPGNMAYRVGLAGFLHSQNRPGDAVQLLQEFSVEYVQLMRCRCCLTRLIGLFEAVGDEERASWCRLRQEVLCFGE